MLYKDIKDIHLNNLSGSHLQTVSLLKIKENFPCSRKVKRKTPKKRFPSHY